MATGRWQTKTRSMELNQDSDEEERVVDVTAVLNALRKEMDENERLK